MRRYFVNGVSAVALTMLVACGGEQAEPAGQTEPAAAAPAAAPAPAAMMMELPDGVTEAMVTEGDGIFHGIGICQTCHGVDAKGVGALAPDLTDEVWLNISGRNYEEIVTLITNGVPTPTAAAAPMPAKGGSNLTDAQIRSVAAYVYSLGQ